MEVKEYQRLGETVLYETLPNGLPVIIVPKKGFSKKYAMFATQYGGMDMKFQLDGKWLDTPAGIAHYLEHKMFDTKDGNALQELATNGAEPNAFTSNAVTCYYFDSTEMFMENLRILLSFVSIPYFTDESVQKEQGIIGQEIGMIEDNPEWQVYKKLMQALYENCPIRTPIAGSVESISHITAQTLYDCHKAFYTPKNMCLVIVGDVEIEPILQLAKEILPTESGPIISRDYGKEEKLIPFQKESIIEMEIAQTTFLAGFKCPVQHGGEEQLRNNYIGDLAMDILLGESSPLYSRLYESGLINGSFGYSYDILPGAAYAYLGGESKDPHKVVQEILAEAEKVVKEGLDDTYYSRLRNANFGSTLKSLNSFESIAISMVEAQFLHYDAFSFPEVYDSISKEDILNFIKHNICKEHMALSTVRPKEE